MTELQLDNVASAQTYTLANGQSASVANMANGETVDFAGDTVTALDLTVNGLGTQAGGGVTIDLNSTAQTDLNLTTAAAASHVLLQNSAAGTPLVNTSVAGDQNVTVDADINNVTLKTVDASAATGDVTVRVDDDNAEDVTVTGGSGDDTVDFGAELTQDDVLDGGEGTDTLEVTQASVTAVQGLNATDKATLNENLSNVEVVEVSDGLTSDIDASRFDSINNYVLAGGLSNGGTSTLSSVASGVSVEIGAAVNDVLAVDITDATKAGNNSDVVNLVLNDNAAGGSSDLGVVNLVGVDELNIDAQQLDSGTTTGYVLDIANTSTALDKVTVTGNTAVDLSGVNLVDSISEVDASGMTLDATDNGLTAAIATGGSNGVKITGSDGVDDLTGGDAADVIDAGAGNDTITGGAGNDELTGGAGSDTFTFAATAAGNGADTITDFTGGAVADGGDVLDFGAFLADAGTTVNANNLSLTSGSSNITLNDDNVYQITLNSDIASKDFGAGDFAELFGAANGQFNTTTNAAGDTAVVMVQGDDTTQIYAVNAGADNTVAAGEVELIGTADVTGDLGAANFA